MPASGRPVEITFTPDADGVVELTATFSSEGDGPPAYWGTNFQAKLFVEQNTVVTYGGGMKMSATRLPYSITASFAVVGGLQVKCGLFAQVGGAATMTLHDCKVAAKYIA